jgi:hypothetical protein
MQEEALVKEKAQLVSEEKGADWDGKQMATWTASEVSEWLESIKEISKLGKQELAKKFKEMKMDEVLNDDDAEGGPMEFIGDDLVFVKEADLRTPAAWEKSKFVVSKIATRIFLEKRDAYLAETEDPQEKLDLEVALQELKQTPMWDWVNNQVRTFFNVQALKTSVKVKLGFNLGDYMLWEEATGHRLLEGKDLMMTGRYTHAPHLYCTYMYTRRSMYVLRARWPMCTT